MNAHPTTLIVNIGEDADPAVTKALAALLETLKESKQKVIQQLDDRESTFGNYEIKKFLLNEHLATSRQAPGFADRAIRNLLDHFLDSEHITAICQNCGKPNGECRCDRSGGENVGYARQQGAWRYYTWSGLWRITYASFLQLTDEDFDKLSKPAGERLKRFQEHLRTQQT